MLHGKALGELVRPHLAVFPTSQHRCHLISHVRHCCQKPANKLSLTKQLLPTSLIMLANSGSPDHQWRR
jgi:hypothetical protein